VQLAVKAVFRQGRNSTWRAEAFEDFGHILLAEDVSNKIEKAIDTTVEEGKELHIVSTKLIITSICVGVLDFTTVPKRPSTVNPRYNEPRYNGFLDITNWPRCLFYFPILNSLILFLPNSLIFQTSSLQIRYIEV